MVAEISFGEWLKHQRMGKGLTREQLARKIGCATITLRKIESEERRPSEQIAERIADIFNIPIGERKKFSSFTRGDYTKAPHEQHAEAPWENPTPRTNLRVSLTSFVGRDKEVADVREYVSNPDTRLITLLGPPGIGKTRLSLAVAHDSIHQFTDGVYFVELAQLEDPNLVALTVTQTLGLVEKHDRSPSKQLKDTIRTKHILIVLDNVEHLLNATASFVSELLSACPYLKILITSREPLRSPGEWLYPLPTLNTPNSIELQFLDLKQLSQFTALRLFTERAHAVQPDFALNDENIQTVTSICNRLDGLPLAIEIIAARVRVMSVQYLLSQMSEQFILSADGMRSIPARQKTLQNAIGWSYNFLTDKEQILFRRLAVFAGGWTLSEAQAVCSDEDLEADQIPDILAHLVDKSLVVQQEWAGMMRYKMLVTIHQFAHEKLLEAGENESARKRHLVCFVKIIEQAEPELFHSNQARWLNRLDDERDNLRTAMEWALTNDIEAGLRIAATPWRFWEPRGYSRELGNWLAQFLERYTISNSLRSHALVVYSQFIAQQGDLSHAHTIASQSLQLSRAISDEQSEAFSLWGLGMVVALQGDLGGAIPIVEQSLTLYQLLGDKLGQATVKGWLCLNNKDQERSKSHIIESLGLYRELGHLSGIALCLSELAHRTIWEGNFSSPSQWLEEARMIYLQLGDQSGEAEALYYYGNLAYWTGEYQQACVFYREAIELLGKVGIYLYALWPRVDMAYATLRQGKISAAKEIFRYCAQEFKKADNMIGVVYSIEGLASLNTNQGQFDKAMLLFAWSDSMREKINDHRPFVEQSSVERDLIVVASKLSNAKVAIYSTEGRAMSLDQVVALALEETN